MFRSVFIRFAILMGCAVGLGDDIQAASHWHEGQSGAKARHSTGNLPFTDGLRFRHDVSLTAAPELGGAPDLTSLSRDFLNEPLERDHRTFTSMPSVFRGASRSARCSAKRLPGFAGAEGHVRSQA